MNRPPSRRPYGQKSTARPPSRRPYGQQRATSTAADKPRIERVTPKPGISLSDVESAAKKVYNRLPPVAVAKTAFKWGRGIQNFVTKKARQILEIPRGTGRGTGRIDTKYRGAHSSTVRHKQ